MYLPLDARRAERRFIVAVVAIFAAAGMFWVFLTDAILYAVVRDPALLARFETAKGWLFVVLATLTLYAVLKSRMTRLARTRATLAAVAESIADGVLLLGPDRTIMHANPAAQRMLGRTDLVGMGAPEFSRRFRVSFPDGRLVPPTEYASQRVFVEGGPISYKAIVYPESGGEMVVSVTAAGVRRYPGEKAEVAVSVMHDITDIERLNQMRDQFFAAAAHALKTPVAIVKSNAQMLAAGAPPEVARSVGAIDRQCRRIGRLIDNLLVLARARSGTLRLYPVEVPLRELVEQVARDMAATSRQNEVHAEIAAEPRVHADPERLAMVFRNLVDNAIRSAEPGTPVALRLTGHDHAAAVGVTYHLRPEPEESAEFREHDDMGISRYVAAAVIQAHGGDMYDETDGAEATRWVRLPVIEGPRGLAGQ